MGRPTAGDSSCGGAAMLMVSFPLLVAGSGGGAAGGLAACNTNRPLAAFAGARRADAVGVIARVAAASVRGWLRRLRQRARQMLQEATAEFGRLAAVIQTPEGRDPCPPGPTGFGLAAALTPAPGS